MEVQNYKCDVCGAVSHKEIYKESYNVTHRGFLHLRASGESCDPPQGWLKITASLGQSKPGNHKYDSFWDTRRDICPECAKPIITILKVWHE